MNGSADDRSPGKALKLARATGIEIVSDDKAIFWQEDMAAGPNRKAGVIQ